MESGERLRVGDWCWLRSKPIATFLDAGDLVEIVKIDTDKIHRVHSVLQNNGEWWCDENRMELFYRADA